MEPKVKEKKITQLSQVCESTVEYTYDDYYEWLFTERVELIFGKVLPMAAPNRIHQTMARNLTGIFHPFFKGKSCEYYPAPAKGAPDLVVEILSPGNSRRDMKDKFEVYELAGVREYWIFHPIDSFVLPYLLNEEGKFIGLPSVHPPDILHSRIFPDLSFSLEGIFQ